MKKVEGGAKNLGRGMNRVDGRTTKWPAGPNPCRPTLGVSKGRATSVPWS